jgi:2-keto-4-pentenoate hydratase/2-oxohepta-3-ene-1,7-dioic acid hydratase in catechol pathway
MKIARALVAGTVRIVAQDAAGSRLAPEGTSDDPLAALRADTAGWQPIDDADLALLAPVARPGKIIAVGLNYADHTTETGFTPPAVPLTFAKYPSSIAAPGATVAIPRHLTQQLDYEVELAVVIGADCGGSTGIAPTLEHVGGYTVANDLSARDVQFSDTQWTRAKSFDGFTPLGPWLVDPAEFGDPAGHRIWTTVNGEILQDDTTASMVFDVPALLAFIGDGTMLERGDIILTGTPSGAGAFLDPPRYLQDGDVVEVGVDGIGVLRTVIAGSGA